MQGFCGVIIKLEALLKLKMVLQYEFGQLVFKWFTVGLHVRKFFLFGRLSSNFPRKKSQLTMGVFISGASRRLSDPMSGFFDTDFDQNYYFYFISKVQLEVYYFLMNKYIIYK